MSLANMPTTVHVPHTWAAVYLCTAVHAQQAVPHTCIFNQSFHSPSEFTASACHAMLHMQAQSDSWQSMHRPELMKLGRSSWRDGRMSLSDRGPAFACSDFILASSPRCTRTMISCTMRLSSGQKCLSRSQPSCQ